MTENEFSKGLVEARIGGNLIAWYTPNETPDCAEKVREAKGPMTKQDNQRMEKHEYSIKEALVLGKLRYFVGDVSNGKFEQTPPGESFATKEEAMDYILRTAVSEANGQKGEPHNQGVNNENIDEIVGRYLAANPDTAKRLVQAATQYEEDRVKKRDAMKRYMECVDAAHRLDVAIGLAQKAVNVLKGDILRLQKERKEAIQQVAEAAELLKPLP